MFFRKSSPGLGRGVGPISLAAWAVLALNPGSAAAERVDPLPVDHPLSLAYVEVIAEKPPAIQLWKFVPTTQVAPRQRRIGDGYVMYTTGSSPGGAGTEEKWELALAQACKKAGGVTAHHYCASSGDPDRLLFVFGLKSWYAPNLNNSSSVEVTYVEPSAWPPSELFQALSRKSGFVSQAEKSERADADRAQLQRERAANLVNIKSLQVRGLSVCRTIGRVRYTAFVEDFTDERLKLLVSSARYLDVPTSTPAGFKQEVIWTPSTGWESCDRLGG